MVDETTAAFSLSHTKRLAVNLAVNGQETGAKRGILEGQKTDAVKTQAVMQKRLTMHAFRLPTWLRGRVDADAGF
jgi:hypothetical protein